MRPEKIPKGSVVSWFDQIRNEKRSEEREDDNGIEREWSSMREERPAKESESRDKILLCSRDRGMDERKRVKGKKKRGSETVNNDFLLSFLVQPPPATYLGYYNCILIISPLLGFPHDCTLMP